MDSARLSDACVLFSPQPVCARAKMPCRSRGAWARCPSLYSLPRVLEAQRGARRSNSVSHTALRGLKAPRRDVTQRAPGATGARRRRSPRRPALLKHMWHGEDTAPSDRMPNDAAPFSDMSARQSRLGAHPGACARRSRTVRLPAREAGSLRSDGWLLAAKLQRRVKAFLAGQARRRARCPVAPSSDTHRPPGVRAKRQCYAADGGRADWRGAPRGRIVATARAARAVVCSSGWPWAVAGAARASFWALGAVNRCASKQQRRGAATRPSQARQATRSKTSAPRAPEPSLERQHGASPHRECASPLGLERRGPVGLVWLLASAPLTLLEPRLRQGKACQLRQAPRGQQQHARRGHRSLEGRPQALRRLDVRPAQTCRESRWPSAPPLSRGGAKLGRSSLAKRLGAPTRRALQTHWSQSHSPARSRCVGRCNLNASCCNRASPRCKRPRPRRPLQHRGLPSGGGRHGWHAGVA